MTHYRTSRALPGIDIGEPLCAHENSINPYFVVSSGNGTALVIWEFDLDRHIADGWIEVANGDSAIKK